MRWKLCIYDSMRANERAQELVTLGRSTARTPLSMVSPASMPADPESAPLRSPAGLRPELETDLGWRRVWVAACLPSANQGSRRGFSSLRRFFPAWAPTQQRSVPARPCWLPLLPPVFVLLARSCETAASLLLYRKREATHEDGGKSSQSIGTRKVGELGAGGFVGGGN